MATKDEALKIAIEFMETLTIDVGIKTWNEKHRKEAIQVCEEALEQPEPRMFLDLSNSNGNHPVEQPAYETESWKNNMKEAEKILAKAKFANEQPAQEPVAWIFEDELPDNYPYDAMFRYSAVIDGVRMFPVFASKHKSSETPLEQAEKYANGNKEIQTAYEDGFIAGTSFQLHREVEKRIAHPAPLWQGLTAKEIALIPLNEYTVQTVERILKEKNNV